MEKHRIEGERKDPPDILLGSQNLWEKLPLYIFLLIRMEVKKTNPGGIIISR